MQVSPAPRVCIPHPCGRHHPRQEGACRGAQQLARWSVGGLGQAKSATGPPGSVWAGLGHTRAASFPQPGLLVRCDPDLMATVLQVPGVLVRPPELQLCSEGGTWGRGSSRGCSGGRPCVAGRMWLCSGRVLPRQRPTAGCWILVLGQSRGGVEELQEDTPSPCPPRCQLGWSQPLAAQGGGLSGGGE